MCLQPYLSNTQCAYAVLYRHLWSVWLYLIFPHYPINGTILWKQKVTEHIMCVFISSKHLSVTFLIPKVLQDISITVRSVRVRYVLFLSYFKATWFFLADFIKILNKFHENPFRGNRVFPCGRTNGQTGINTDMTKLTVHFRNLANTTKNDLRVHVTQDSFCYFQCFSDSVYAVNGKLCLVQPLS